MNLLLPLLVATMTPLKRGVVLLFVVACAKPSREQPDVGLPGSSWQLVMFEGGDGTTLIPDDGSKYTIAFGADNAVRVRIDCNRGRGSWRETPPSGLELGPLALTRALCPPGS